MLHIIFSFHPGHFRPKRITCAILNPAGVLNSQALLVETRVSGHLYLRLDKTPFAGIDTQTLYLHIPEIGQLLLRTIFLLPKGTQGLRLTHCKPK